MRDRRFFSSAPHCRFIYPNVLWSCRLFSNCTDATDLIFSRILYCLLDLNRIFLRLSARDFSFLLCGLKALKLLAQGNTLGYNDMKTLALQGQKRN